MLLHGSWTLVQFTFEGQNGDFPIRNMEISIFFMNQWFFMYCHVFPVCICVPIPYTCVLVLHVCVCVCVWVCVQGSCPLQTQRGRLQKMRCGATKRGGTRRSQTRGDWSMHLCDAPVQDRNEERMTSDSSGQGLCKSAVTSRGITKLTISAVLCVCISKQWRGARLKSHPEEINQMMWGFKTTICGLITVCGTLATLWKCWTRLGQDPRF